MRTDFKKNKSVENILEKKYEAQIREFGEVNFNIPNKRTQKSKCFPLCPESKEVSRCFTFNGVYQKIFCLVFANL